MDSEPQPDPKAPPGPGPQFRDPSEALPFIEAPGAEQPVRISEVTVEVHICGGLSEVTQTLRFENPNSRDLEGTLVFPLPPSATVCGYALDVDGALVDGVVVKKEEARRILETEVARKADPGLVEQVAGNVYRTRVYPVPAGGHRTVRLTWVDELAAEGDAQRLDLPLEHARQASGQLELTVAQADSRPTVTLGGREVPMEGSQGNFQLKTAVTPDQGDLPPDADPQRPPLVLSVSLPDTADRQLALESNPDGQRTFRASLRRADAGDADGWAPGRIALAWDASGSRQALDAELDLLAALLEAWPGVVVDLVVLRDRLTPGGSFDTGADGAGALLEALRGLAYDGGTRLTRLDLSRPPHADCEAWLLFSDGLGTLSKGLPDPAGRRLIAVSGDPVSDQAWLRHLAARSGGVFVDAGRQSPEAAVAAVRRCAGTPRLSEFEGCRDVHVEARGDRVLVTGRLLRDRGRVVVEGAGLDPAPLILKADQASPGQVLARAWAGVTARKLALIQKPGSDEVLALGRAHGVVTPGTSLLVLETLEQHLEHGVEPPESRAEMRAAYLDQRAEVERAEAERLAGHLDRVHGLWTQRVEWWETTYATKDEVLAEGERVGPPKGRRREAQPGLLARMTDAVFGSGDEPVERMSMFASMGNECEEMAMADMDDGLADLEAGAPPPPPPPPSPAPMAQPVAAARIACVPPPGGGPPQPKKAAEDGGPAAPSIQIQAWSPDAPYLDALKAADDEQVEAAYLAARVDNARSPSFFLDCGDHLLGRGLREEGLRVLSNLAELDLGDAAVLRMYAWRLRQASELEAAIELLEDVLEARPDEPQSHRDLALALGERFEARGDPADGLRSAALLWHVVSHHWPRFPEIELIALMELNRLLRLLERDGVEVPAEVEPRFRKLLDLDLRISMSWDTDLTDVDLHVYEPTGEHAYYGSNRTRIGGLVSRDFTQGYGPEEYVLRRAASGKYEIKAHYYSSHQQTLTGACTVVVEVFTDFGRDSEQRQVLTLRLDEPGREVRVGAISR